MSNIPTSNSRRNYHTTIWWKSNSFFERSIFQKLKIAPLSAERLRLGNAVFYNNAELKRNKVWMNCLLCCFSTAYIYPNQTGFFSCRNVSEPKPIRKFIRTHPTACSPTAQNSDTIKWKINHPFREKKIHPTDRNLMGWPKMSVFPFTSFVLLNFIR